MHSFCMNCLLCDSGHCVCRNCSSQKLILPPSTLIFPSHSPSPLLSPSSSPVPSSLRTARPVRVCDVCYKSLIEGGKPFNRRNKDIEKKGETRKILSDHIISNVDFGYFSVSELKNCLFQ